MSCGICFLTIIAIVAVLVKVYLKLRIRQNGCMNCLIGKTIIVTGANTGIGYETALDFAQRGARVILACRNKARAEDAEFRIRKASGNQNVVHKILDLASFKSIREFAKDINSTEKRLDILVNNAGGIGFGNHVTEDGNQIQMQTNHVGPFLLTHLLLNKLKSSKPSRIVNVASLAGRYGKIEINELNKYPTDVREFVAEGRIYRSTKLANIFFTTELAKKLKGTSITVNTLHPGAIKTEFSRRFPKILKAIIGIFEDFYFKTSQEGAQTTIYVALSKDLEGVSGGLFDNCKHIDLYKSAYDQNLAKQLWHKTEQLAKLKDDEKLK